MSKSIDSGLSASDLQNGVRDFYDSFQPQNTSASKLAFYADLQKRFDKIKIPDSLAKLTFGCLNPVSHLINDFESKKAPFSSVMSILDAGGGAGFDSFLLKQIFPNAVIYNVDLSHNLLKLGSLEFQKHLGIKVNAGNGVNFICSSLCEVNFFKNIKFDYIISNAALNLIDDKKRVLALLADLLKDDGSFFLADIAFSKNSDAPKNTAGRNLKNGIYNAPTIIYENDYADLIFNSFGYSEVIDKKNVKPELLGGAEFNFTIFCSHIKKTPPAESETIPCPCGEKVALQVFLSVNAEASPLYVQMIHDRKLNSARCAKCGRIFQDFVPYYFEWPQKNIRTHVFPSSLKNERRMILSRLGIFEEPPAGFIFFGYEEFRNFLIEKTALK